MRRPRTSRGRWIPPSARPLRRPSPPGSLTAAFADLALLGLGVFIGAGFLFAWRSRESLASAPGGAIRVAVLPFENLGDSADAYFADGMTDALRGKLAGLPDVEIIGATSSGQYRHTSETPQQIGNELGARYLLVGKIRWAKVAGGGSRVQVSPELLDARTAATRWGAPFDASLTDVFQVRRNVAGEVGGCTRCGLEHWGTRFTRCPADQGRRRLQRVSTGHFAVA